MRYHISKEQRESYIKNGYFIARGLLPVESIEYIRNQAHKIIKQQLFRFEIQPKEDLQEDMKLLLEKDAEAYLGSLRLMAKMACVRNLISCRSIEEAVADLGCKIATISESPVFHVMSDKLKIPNGYFGFDAHQDWTSIQGALDVLVVWIPLVPVSKENFPLTLIPKSNQKGLLPGVIEENVYHVDLSRYDADEYMVVEAEVGDVAFMSGWTVHKTGVDGCSGFRIAISNRWEDASEPTFVQRNYPCAYKKYVQREWITPDFPNLSQIQDAFKR